MEHSRRVCVSSPRTRHGSAYATEQLLPPVVSSPAASSVFLHGSFWTELASVPHRRPRPRRPSSCEPVSHPPVSVLRTDSLFPPATARFDPGKCPSYTCRTPSEDKPFPPFVPPRLQNWERITYSGFYRASFSSAGNYFSANGCTSQTTVSTIS